jgi:hypothetical protein
VYFFNSAAVQRFKEIYDKTPQRGTKKLLFPVFGHNGSNFFYHCQILTYSAGMNSIISFAQ